MKTLFVSALIALTLSTATTAFATDNKENTEAKSTFESAVYPVINSMKVRVNVNKAKDSKVHIRLMDQAGQTLTSLKLGKDNESSSIRFDLNTLEDGIYKVEISDGFRTEVKTVKLQTSTPETMTSRAISLN